MIKKVMILSGGFDPIHSGHIDLFENAKKVSDLEEAKKVLEKFREENHKEFCNHG